MHCFQTANTRKHQNYKAKTPEPLLIKDSEALIREATTRFELVIRVLQTITLIASFSAFMHVSGFCGKFFPQFFPQF